MLGQKYFLELWIALQIRHRTQVGDRVDIRTRSNSIKALML